VFISVPIFSCFFTAGVSSRDLQIAAHELEKNILQKQTLCFCRRDFKRSMNECIATLENWKNAFYKKQRVVFVCPRF